MKITNLSAIRLHIPFNVNFKHALADRSETETIIVMAESSNGEIGYGEGCPRLYVTGETLNSSIEFVNRYKKSILELTSLSDLKSFVELHKQQIDLNPAAWCAVEIALLDLMGKETKQSIESILSLPDLDSEFEYTAVIGDWETDTTAMYIDRYMAAHFNNYKIKLSGNMERDLTKIHLIRQRGLDTIKIRLDANKLWKNSSEAYVYLKQLDHYYQYYQAVEEPFSFFSHNKLRELSRKLQIKIILDESFCRIEDFDKLKKDIETFIINIRISKMGGLLRSLLVAEKAISEGYEIIVGAQVGETSILSRAALPLANKYNGKIIAHEGAFGNYLLLRDIAMPQIKFESRGIFNTSVLKNSGVNGLGLYVSI